MIYLAHGIGGVRDLPVPTWLFFWGAAIALVASFVLLGALWKRPLLERHEDGRLLPRWLTAILLSRALASEGPVRRKVPAPRVADAST